jgi:hypothetical protein
MISCFYGKGDPMKKILPFVIGLILIPLTCAEWNMFMHDEEHTGFNDIEMQDINADIWSVDLEGQVCSSPMIVENIIYIGSEKYLSIRSRSQWKLAVEKRDECPLVFTYRSRQYIRWYVGWLYLLFEQRWKDHLGY